MWFVLGSVAQNKISNKTLIENMKKRTELFKIHHKNLKSTVALDETFPLPEDQGLYFQHKKNNDYTAYYVTDKYVGIVLSHNNEEYNQHHKTVFNIQRTKQSTYTRVTSEGCDMDKSFLAMEGDFGYIAKMSGCKLSKYASFTEIYDNCETLVSITRTLCESFVFGSSSFVVYSAEAEKRQLSTKYYMADSVGGEDILEANVGSNSEILDLMNKDDKASVLFPSLIVILLLLSLF